MKVLDMTSGANYWSVPKQLSDLIGASAIVAWDRDTNGSVTWKCVFDHKCKFTLIIYFYPRTNGCMITNGHGESWVWTHDQSNPLTGCWTRIPD